MSLNEYYSNMDAAQLRKILQQKSLISQKYRTLDAAGGGEEYCYFRTKEDSFKPSKNQGAGLTIEFFEEEASSKGLKRGLDYFISLEDYRTFIGGYFEVKEQIKVITFTMSNTILREHWQSIYMHVNTSLINVGGGLLWSKGTN